MIIEIVTKKKSDWPLSSESKYLPWTVVLQTGWNCWNPMSFLIAVIGVGENWNTDIRRSNNMFTLDLHAEDETLPIVCFDHSQITRYEVCWYLIHTLLQLATYTFGPPCECAKYQNVKNNIIYIFFICLLFWEKKKDKRKLISQCGSASRMGWTYILWARTILYWTGLKMSIASSTLMMCRWYWASINSWPKNKMGINK